MRAINDSRDVPKMELTRSPPFPERNMAVLTKIRILIDPVSILSASYWDTALNFIL